MTTLTNESVTESTTDFDVTTPAVAKLIADNKTALLIDHAHKVALAQKGAGL